MTRASLLLVLVACSSESIDQRIIALPTWEEFSPPLPDVDPQPVPGRAPVEFSQKDVYEIIDDEGVTVVDDAQYDCVSVPYTMTSTPEDIVMLNPDVELLWPGALLQGRSHRDGLGSLDTLPIAERAPLEISIPAIASGTNFRTVERPTQAQVAAAIGGIVGDAVAADIVTPSTISYQVSTFSSEQQFALSIDASGHYLGFSASAGVDVESTQTRNTIAAQFYQRMYEVVVAPPATPGALFSDEFTPEKYEEQEALGRIGPDNLPIYVSNVVYGRMMTFSLTSSASEDELRAILNASYDALVGGVEVELEARQQQILSSAEIRIATLGGDADAALAMIRTGNLNDYFATNAPLSSAAPLTYTFRNLGDNSIASVSESTEYNVTACTARLPGEILDMVPLQEVPAPVPVPYEVAVGDFNGDGVDDLVWNHRGPGENVFAFGYGAKTGMFLATDALVHPEDPPEGWATYDLVVGDFDADGVDDLRWGHLQDGNYSYVARLDGTEWVFEDRQVFGSTSWVNYALSVGEVDEVPGDDLVFNDMTTGLNRTWVYGHYAPGVGFSRNGLFDHPGVETWTGFEQLLGDVDADGRDDLIFWEGFSGAVDGTVALGLADGDVFIEGGITNPLLFNVTTATLDFNGDSRADLVQVQPSYGVVIATAVDCSGADCGAAFATDVVGPPAGYPLIDSAWTVADLNGDGLEDVVFYELDGETNELQVAFADGNEGVFPSPVQVSPFRVLDWSAYEVLTGDFNGDGGDDVIWHQSGANAEIYLGESHAQ